MSEQVKSAVRSALKILGTWLVAHGIADSTDVEAAIGGLVAAIGIVWSFVTHKAPSGTEAPK